MNQLKALKNQLSELEYDENIRNTFHPIFDQVKQYIHRSHFLKRADYLEEWEVLKDEVLDLSISFIDKSDELDFRKIQRKLINFIHGIIKENKKIFIVHGRDHNMRNGISSFLGRLKLDHVILDTESNGGRTIIEKFMQSAADCDYAIVLFSADDLGKLAEDGAIEKFRARQNVVLELGYFLSKVGRENIMILHSSDKQIEQPSDFSGIVYESFDPHGAWKGKAIREMRKAGIYIDQQLADKA